MLLCCGASHYGPHLPDVTVHIHHSILTAVMYVNGSVVGVQALEGKMVDTNRTLLLGATSDGEVVGVR